MRQKKNPTLGQGLNSLGQELNSPVAERRPVRDMRRRLGRSRTQRAWIGWQVRDRDDCPKVGFWCQLSADKMGQNSEMYSNWKGLHQSQEGYVPLHIGLVKIILVATALWRACNLTSFSPCLTGPVDYLFACRHKWPGFKSPGGYLCGTGILLLAMSRYSTLFFRLVRKTAC